MATFKWASSSGTLKSILHRSDLSAERNSVEKTVEAAVGRAAEKIVEKPVEKAAEKADGKADDESSEGSEARLACAAGYFEARLVRVYPGCLVFEDPFEGRRYEEAVTVVNAGRSPVMVRVFDPSSTEILIKSPKREVKLSPGLSIHALVHFTVNTATLAEEYFLRFEIDEVVYQYPIYVHKRPVKLIAEPEVLDYGKVDTGPSITKRSFKLINKTNVPIRYNIDIRKQEALTLTTQNSKGIVMQSSEVTISVDMNTFIEGKHITEFWIICTSPICIKVKADAVNGIIKQISQKALSSITFIKFPKTYYGVKSMTSIVVKNFSHRDSMFCTTAEFNGESVHLGTGEQLDSSFENFQMAPVSGHLFASESRPFIFTFEPVQRKVAKNAPILAELIIHKISCTNFDSSNYDTRSTSELQESIKGSMMADIVEKGLTLSSTFVETVEDVGDENLDIEQFFKSEIRVILYGMAIKASASCLPNEITIDDPGIDDQGKNAVASRTIIIVNNSKLLPVYYKYKKEHCIRVSPDFGKLEAEEKKELMVDVRIDRNSANRRFINFDLLYFDSPKLNNVLKHVGGVEVGVFVKERSLATKKKDDAAPLVPIKRRHSLEFTKIPDNEEDKYKYVPPVDVFKKKNREYYDAYIHKKSTIHSVAEEPDGSALNLTCLKTACDELTISRKAAHHSYYNCSSLTPQQLHNVTINPRALKIPFVAPNSQITNTINISNRNKIPIQVHIRPHKSFLFSFDQGDRHFVEPKEEKSIRYTFHATSIGTWTDIVDVVVNESHVFETTFRSVVVPPQLLISTEAIKFKANDPTWCVVEITNPSNVELNTGWLIVADIKVHPKEALVDPGKTISYILSYEIGKTTVSSYDLVAYLGYFTKNVNLVIDPMKYSVDFPKAVSFGNVAFNVPSTQMALLSNSSAYELDFVVDADEMSRDVEVWPRSGKVNKLSAKPIYFTILRNEEGIFSYKASILVANQERLQFELTATVEFPTLTLSTSNLRMKKITASSFDISKFTVYNVGKVPAFFGFLMSHIPFLNLVGSIGGAFIDNADSFVLKPGESRYFYLCYNPKTAEAISHNLPITINGLTNHKNFPKMVIRVACDDALVKVNTWDIHFKQVGLTVHAETTNIFEITNPDDTQLKFCLRLDDMNEPFNFQHLAGGTVNLVNCSLVCSLKKEETAKFKASFKSTTVNKYTLKIPLYIRDDVNEDIHNYLTLSGDHVRPEMLVESSRVYLGTIPINFVLEKVVRVRFVNHTDTCVVDTAVDIEEYTLCVAVSEKDASGVTVKLEYSSADTHVLKTTVDVSCSCGGLVRLKCCGGVEACLLSNHLCVLYSKHALNKSITSLFRPSTAHLMGSADSRNQRSSEMSFDFMSKTREFRHPLPFYPSADDELMHPYMEALVRTLEQWLFQQVWMRKRYHNIPDTVCLYEVRVDAKKARRGEDREASVALPYQEVLRVLGGSVVGNLDLPIGNKALEIDTVKLIHAYYQNALNFLLSSNGMVAHVRAEHLLPYLDYGLYMLSVRPAEAALSIEDFHSVSKQSWTDFILQTYKVLVYRRLYTYWLKSSNEAERKTISCCTYRVDQLSGFLERQQRVPVIYSPECSMLLNWLEKCVALTRVRLQPEPFGLSDFDFLRDKRMRTFDSDLKDCVALFCITINYCNFLVPHLVSFYFSPAKPHEYVHNACLLTKVWTMLNYSFRVVPEDLLNPHPIKMLMLVAYMYEFLTHFKVIDVVEMKANLSSATSTRLIVDNHNDEKIKYTIMFFGNEDEMFKSDAEYVYVPGRASAKVLITYTAKFFKRVEAVIVFNGENNNGLYAYSGAFTLIGLPVITSAYCVSTLTTTVFESKSFKVDLQSPYKQAAVYETFFSYEKPVIGTPLIPAVIVINKKMISRILMLNPMHLANDDGQFRVKVIVSSICVEPLNLWILFKSKIGDFLVYFSNTVLEDETPTPLVLVVPEEITLCRCNCKGKPEVTNAGCPYNVTLEIPTVNKNIWKTIINVYTMLHHEDKAFWLKHQNSVLGYRLLQNILHTNRLMVTTGMLYIFKEVQEFKVSSDSKGIIVPDYLVLSTEDVTHMRVHISSKLAPFTVILRSSKNEEMRRYRVSIVTASNE